MGEKFGPETYDDFRLLTPPKVCSVFRKEGRVRVTSVPVGSVVGGRVLCSGTSLVTDTLLPQPTFLLVTAVHDLLIVPS